MTTQTHDLHSAGSELGSPVRSLSSLRAARRARRAALDSSRDVARQLPGYPTSHRGAFAVDLLADSRRPAV